MTIFAVLCAGIFPGIHIGRVWVAYWLFPLPNQMAMWPNFRSPLLWDVFAVDLRHGVAPVLVHGPGARPGHAARPREDRCAAIYGILSLGLARLAPPLAPLRAAYLLLAGLATPLVLSVHSVVSFDFATSQIPGWHTTIFPPYFVAGAIFSGFAMVLTLMMPARKWFGLKHSSRCATSRT
jgi:Ni/Fe-hydrogenase subunit HybB-like protein